MHKKHPHWMCDLLTRNSPYGTKPLNTIMIPGTHDSGTFGMGESTRTQSLSIGEQLDLGIRYFDFRVRINNDTYFFYHTISSDNDMGTKSDDPTGGNVPDRYALKQMRNFLIDNPKEILILKIQDPSDFGELDYGDFIDMVKKYLEFTAPSGSTCALVPPDAQNITKSIKELTDAGTRVFIFFDQRNVPTGAVQAARMWDYAFKYEPVLAKGNFKLWDPYWGDDSSLSVNDTDTAHMHDFWNWHKTNLATWNSDGFFVLQSHMQQLNLSGNGSDYDFYYNIAEQVADGNYYMNQHASTGDFYSNNHRNIVHYVNWFKGGTPINIITFDYAQNGNVCDAIVNFYKGSTLPHSSIISGQPIYLRLNELNRYIGPLRISDGRHYPVISEQAQVLYIGKVTGAGELKDGDQVMIITREDAAGEYTRLSVYAQNELYYDNVLNKYVYWTIRKGKPGSVINDADHVWFESMSYEGQFLTLDDADLTTRKMDLPTRWVVNNYSTFE